MTAGLRTYDTAGNRLLDITDRAGRTLGVISSGKSDGSVTHAAFADGTPWWSVRTPTSGPALAQPSFAIQTIGGALHIVWTWRTSGASFNTPCTIRYGVH